MRFPLFIILTSAILTGCALPALPLPGAASPSVPSGSVLVQDDFGSAASGWNRLQNEGGIMDYDGSGYRILVTARDSNVWSTQHRDFRDARVEVDAGKLVALMQTASGLSARGWRESLLLHYWQRRILWPWHLHGRQSGPSRSGQHAAEQGHHHRRAINHCAWIAAGIRSAAM